MTNNKEILFHTVVDKMMIQIHIKSVASPYTLFTKLLQEYA